MITPEIRELQMFLALVKTGSFSAAAQQMGVSQPAVSAQIVKLEQMLGFPLFYRGPEGTTITDQGRSFLSFAEDVVKEYTDLLRRAAYWKRARSNQVKIWTDGSRVASELKATLFEVEDIVEEWQELEETTDWLRSLRNLDVDIVLAGSFLKAGDAPGIKAVNVRHQRGVTIAWNPRYYLFNPATFSLPDAIASTAILPAPSLAIGFREFLDHWCQHIYGILLEEALECRRENDAVNACKQGLGVMIFPGDAEERMKLHQAGLQTLRTFEFILPKAFTFGIRYRIEEQNPKILATVARMAASIKNDP